MATKTTFESAVPNGTIMYYPSKYSDDFVEIVVKEFREEFYGRYVTSTKGVHYPLNALLTKKPSNDG